MTSDAEGPGARLDVRLLAHPAHRATVRVLAHALAHELRALGVSAALEIEGYPDDADARSVFVVVCPEVLHGLTGIDIAMRPDLFGRTVVVLADDSALEAADEAMSWYRAAGAVMATDPAVVDRLQDHGVDARRLLVGRTAAWTVEPSPAPIEVVSTGAASPHRGRALAGCADVLAGRPAALWFDDASTTADPLARLAGADVALLVHDDAARHRFDWVQASLAMHAGAVVVSERTGGAAPLVPGEQYVSCAPESMPMVLDALREDDALRRRLSGAAADWLDRHPLADAAATLVELAAPLTARPAPWSGMPLPARANDDQPRPLADDEDASVVRRVLREVRLDLMDLRRGQQRAELLARAPGTAVDETQTLLQPQPDRRPRVSVLTAVYQHAHHVTEALGSVAASHVRDVEVVVVDDGSTDGSAEAVTDFARAHEDLPITLLRHPVNRGLGAARNTALAHAAGELVLVLDADNAVRAEGLGSLVAALDADPEAAMAYGLLDSFDVHGPAGVLNAYEWDPARFRTGNYIDAMALSRTELIRELGGFTTDRRLYGWEDFDLWCGFAQRGWRGVRVPNFVGRYRSSPTSMVAVSDYSHHAPFAALVERHPDLMRGVVPPR
jgi:hypothetical protein